MSTYVYKQALCYRLYSLLGQYSDDIKVEQITGNMSKSVRTKVIKQFSNGNIDV